MHPAQFVQDPKTGIYEAKYTLEGQHAAAALNMSQDQLYDAVHGITGVEDARLWGGGVTSAMTIGTENDKREMQKFRSVGRSGAGLTESGHVIRGHIIGDSEGMIKPVSLDFDTTEGPWLDTDAAQSLGKHQKTASQVKSEAFQTHQSVQVDGQTYALITPESAVGRIINTYGKDKAFYGGIYANNNHIVDGKMLVSQDHYNELHQPLVKAMEQTEKPLVFSVKTGLKPSTPINFSMGLRHGIPRATEESGQLVASKFNEERTDAVRQALQKMKLAGGEAQVKFSAPEPQAAATAGSFEAEEDAADEDA